MHSTPSIGDRAAGPERLSAHLPRHQRHTLPSGVWFCDSHLDGPVIPFIEPMLAAFGRGFRTGFARWGLPLDGLDQALVDGWLYMTLRFLTDPAVLGPRVVRAEAIADLAEITGVAGEWIDEVLPRTDAARLGIARGTLADIDDDGLADGLVAVYALVVEFAERRFADVPAINLLTAAFLVDGAAAGLSRAECLAQLAGSSRSTTSMVRDAMTLDGAELAERYADELLSTDGAEPTLADLAGGWWVRSVPPAAPGAHTSDVPRQLTATLAAARLAQDVREASRELLMRLMGRARRIALELGRRMVAAGVLEGADDVSCLTPDEILAAHSADLSTAAVRALVRSRRHDLLAGAAAVPEPMLVGAAAEADPAAGSSDPPPMPPGAQRVMELAMTWSAAMDGVGAPPATAASAGQIVGVPASPGTVSGPVRVVHHVADLMAVEPGDIIVCSSTTPAWCVAIAMCSGLVSTSGGDCCHAAIVAREFAIPAVVGAVAAAALRTGDVVTVDGTAGTVTFHPAH